MSWPSCFFASWTPISSEIDTSLNPEEEKQSFIRVQAVLDFVQKILLRGNSYYLGAEDFLTCLCFKQTEIAFKHSNLTRINANKRESHCSFQKC